MDLGARIRNFRELRGLSQDLVAAKMQLRGHSTITQPTQAKVESGERDVSYRELISYARILRVSITELLGEPDFSEDN